MAEPNKILVKMLDRLLAGLVNGPSLNCRPYASRQRLDWVQLGKLGDAKPEATLRAIFGSGAKAVVKARVTKPKADQSNNSESLVVADSIEAADEQGIPLADGPLETKPAPDDSRSPERAWLEQQAVLNKLHRIAEDARTYEQDTGVRVLNIGFPLLSLPPGTFGGGKSSATRRVLAPLGFIPVAVTVKRGAATSIELACKGEGSDRVIPNTALFAWLEQQTGKSALETDDEKPDAAPWREICSLVRGVCATLDLVMPELFTVPAGEDDDLQKHADDVAPDFSSAEHDTELQQSSPDASADSTAIQDVTEQTPASQQPAPTFSIPDNLQLVPAPKSDETGDVPRIISSAIVGLFPLANQGLLRDTQAMLAAGDGVKGPVESFIRLGVDLDVPVDINEPLQPAAALPGKSSAVTISEERFVTRVDPFQGRAVRLARECPGLVVHGPPGTGKSQTITNIIGDHLARGQRVLVVCDKRTALDVVSNRLNHMGLGKLCALVHDPRRDHREYYKAIRQQLDDLHETASDSKAGKKLAKIDGELQSLHNALSHYRDSLEHRPGEHGANFQELVGEWLSLEDSRNAEMALQGINLKTLNVYGAAVGDVLRRGESIDYARNPWVAAAGLTLGDFLAQPMDKIRAQAKTCEDAAESADATLDPLIPPFAAHIPLQQQTATRVELAKDLAHLIETADPAILARWATETNERLVSAAQRLRAADAFIQTFHAGPLDSELLANCSNRKPEDLPIAEQLLRVANYQAVAGKWYAFFPLKAKTLATTILGSYGLTTNAENAARLQKFLTGLRARIVLSQLIGELHNAPASMSGQSVLRDDLLKLLLKGHGATLQMLLSVRGHADRAELAKSVALVLVQPGKAGPLIEGLHKSPPRAEALEKLEETTARGRLFDPAWLAAAQANIRAGKPSLPVFTSLREHVETLEGVLRVRQGLGLLTPELRAAAQQLLSASLDAKQAEAMLRREALAVEISARLQADPHLNELDAARLDDAFTRYRELDERKRELTRNAILHYWVSRQKERLLAASGNRLNSDGAELRRRLMLRGERAMRLRQVLEIGRKRSEGADPLFDLTPVWLCSPETVAQIFPREPVFDVVVFDEASQLRLEESLPVLVRGKRMVIAGDPRQLPPTRFFESALAVSEEDDDAQTDQDLFERQQGEVEDLLAAALGLDLQQCYLDVHYRSRYSELIAFSNEHFYASRLQPIPSHPSAPREASPPVELEHVGGTYNRRRNDAEADRIVEIIAELLSRKEPPSIGVACFNLVQRDLVAEKLDDLASQDAAFSKRLEKARTRQGTGSFEGLFIKNLENVQGDERDYILISTTYGPDASGKFYRRFGPLGRSGGGRRLNVLITRAREKVHIVTSIPADTYSALPAPERGQTPGGAWLLFAYLKFAENLKRIHAPDHPLRNLSDDSAATQACDVGYSEDPAKIINKREHLSTSSSSSQGVLPAVETNAAETRRQTPADSIAQIDKTPARPVIHPTLTPSAFAQAFAQHLADKGGAASDVYWGNEGFCVDVAMRDPKNLQEVTLGLLCDSSRFTPADDPVQWDIFRTEILEAQGWKLRRIWTPHFFRDSSGVTRSVINEAASQGEKITPPDAIIRVSGASTQANFGQNTGLPRSSRQANAPG